MDYAKQNSIGIQPSKTISSSNLFAKLAEIDKLIEGLKSQQNMIQDHLSALNGPTIELPNKADPHDRLLDFNIIRDRLDMIILQLTELGNKYEHIQVNLSNSLSK